MHDTLNPYPAYTPSGVPWLGDVPAHWDVARVKQLYSIRLGKMLQNRPTSSTDTQAPYLKAKNVQWFSVDITDAPTMWASPDEIEQYGIRTGDLLVCEGGEGGRCGLVGEIPAGFIIQNALHRVRPLRSCRNDYLQYVMAVVAKTGWFDATNSKATIAHFTAEKFGSLPTPLPPPAEQTAIVRYLDHADRQIRRYVSGKEKLIGLLEEQRQAVVQHAVTRGLDPDVRLKPSGVNWLGGVPAHWEVQRLKWVASLNPSKTEVRSSLMADTPVTFLPMERVGTDGRIETGEMLSASDVWNGFTYFGRKDVLVAKITPCFENGKGACLDSLPTEVGFGSTEFHVLRAGPSISPQFLYRLTTLEEFRRLGVNSMTGAAGQQRVPQTFVANYPIAIPPLPEQAAIVEYLDKATADIDTAVARARREIELLREYRTRLIADVVTGKVDVRAAADEVDVPRQFDNTGGMRRGTDES